MAYTKYRINYVKKSILMNNILDKKILVVEDVDLARYMIINKLKKLGYTNITDFDNSAEAWEEIAEKQLADEQYDIVLTDLNMPDLDGMDLLEYIKNDPMIVKLPVVIISADADPFVIDEAMTLGADGYFTKPVKFDELHIKLQEILK